MKLSPKTKAKKKSVSTNFPTSTTNKFIFTKIHARNPYYELSSGSFVGSGKLSDTDELPDGRRITKHSFWFPKRFVKEILDGKWNQILWLFVNHCVKLNFFRSSIEMV